MEVQNPESYVSSSRHTLQTPLRADDGVDVDSQPHSDSVTTSVHPLLANKTSIPMMRCDARDRVPLPSLSVLFITLPLFALLLFGVGYGTITTISREMGELRWSTLEAHHQQVQHKVSAVVSRRIRVPNVLTSSLILSLADAGGGNMSAVLEAIERSRTNTMILPFPLRVGHMMPLLCATLREASSSEDSIMHSLTLASFTNQEMSMCTWFEELDNGTALNASAATRSQKRVLGGWTKATLTPAKAHPEDDHRLLKVDPKTLKFESPIRFLSDLKVGVNYSDALRNDSVVGAALRSWTRTFNCTTRGCRVPRTSRRRLNSSREPSHILSVTRTSPEVVVVNYILPFLFRQSHVGTSTSTAAAETAKQEEAARNGSQFEWLWARRLGFGFLSAQLNLRLALSDLFASDAVNVPLLTRSVMLLWWDSARNEWVKLADSSSNTARKGVPLMSTKLPVDDVGCTLREAQAIRQNTEHASDDQENVKPLPRSCIAALNRRLQEHARAISQEERGNQSKDHFSVDTVHGILSILPVELNPRSFACMRLVIFSSDAPLAELVAMWTRSAYIVAAGVVLLVVRATVWDNLLFPLRRILKTYAECQRATAMRAPESPTQGTEISTALPSICHEAICAVGALVAPWDAKEEVKGMSVLSSTPTVALAEFPVLSVVGDLGEGKPSESPSLGNSLDQTGSEELMLQERDALCRDATCAVGREYPTFTTPSLVPASRVTSAPPHSSPAREVCAARMRNRVKLRWRSQLKNAGHVIREDGEGDDDADADVGVDGDEQASKAGNLRALPPILNCGSQIFGSIIVMYFRGMSRERRCQHVDAIVETFIRLVETYHGQAELRVPGICYASFGFHTSNDQHCLLAAMCARDIVGSLPSETRAFVRLTVDSGNYTFGLYGTEENNSLLVWDPCDRLRTRPIMANHPTSVEVSDVCAAVVHRDVRLLPLRIVRATQQPRRPIVLYGLVDGDARSKEWCQVEMLYVKAFWKVEAGRYREALALHEKLRRSPELPVISPLLARLFAHCLQWAALQGPSAALPAPAFAKRDVSRKKARIAAPRERERERALLRPGPFPELPTDALSAATFLEPAAAALLHHLTPSSADRATQMLPSIYRRLSEHALDHANLALSFPGVHASEFNESFSNRMDGETSLGSPTGTTAHALQSTNLWRDWPTSFADIRGIRWTRAQFPLSTYTHAASFAGISSTGMIAILLMFDKENVETAAYNTGNEWQAAYDNCTIVSSKYVAQRISWASTSTHFIVVEQYITGESLQGVLLRYGRLPPTAAVQRYVSTILTGLRALGDANRIHGNLNLSNIMLTADGTCCLKNADSWTSALIKLSQPSPNPIKSAKAQSNTLSSRCCCCSSTCCSTCRAHAAALSASDAEKRSEEHIFSLLSAAPKASWYISPEVVAGSPRTAASDVFAVGVITYQLLRGTLPWQYHPPPPVSLLGSFASSDGRQNARARTAMGDSFDSRIFVGDNFEIETMPERHRSVPPGIPPERALEYWFLHDLQRGLWRIEVDSDLDPVMREFVLKCCATDPSARPSIPELLALISTSSN